LSNCWVTGGPTWLFPFVLSAGIVALISGGLFWALQRDARISSFGRPDEKGNRRGVAAATAGISALVFSSVLNAGPTPWWVGFVEMGIPATAAAITIRSARQQVTTVPTGYPLRWSDARGPSRWSLPAVAVLAVIAAVWAIIAMFALGSPC
jgi:hypothetical protein